MKNALFTLVLTAFFSAPAWAQLPADSTRRDSTRYQTPTNNPTNPQATYPDNRPAEPRNEPRPYRQRNEMTWFQPGNIFLGAGLGFGFANQRVYSDINTRLGYFIRTGLAAGIRYDYERLIGVSNKYSARQFGLFARYYPFRSRLSGFLGAGINFGREFSSNIPTTYKARYTSIGLEIGMMAWVARRLGLELSYESNFYNKLDPTLGRGKGGRIKVGANYFFGSVRRAPQSPYRY